jgi:hypothetical protein
MNRGYLKRKGETRTWPCWVKPELSSRVETLSIRLDSMVWHDLPKPGEMR